MRLLKAPRVARKKGSDPFWAPFGFTLLEVIVATMIFALISTALASIFSVSLRLWKRVNFERVREEATLALTGIIERREETRPFSLLEITDEPGMNELIFAGLVKGKSGARELGEIRYSVTSDGRLLREERTFPQWAAKEEGKKLEVAHAIEKLTSEDLFFNDNSGKFQKDPVLGETSKDIVPRPDAVRITLQFKTADGKTHSLERIVALS